MYYRRMRFAGQHVGGDEEKKEAKKEGTDDGVSLAESPVDAVSAGRPLGRESDYRGTSLTRKRLLPYDSRRALGMVLV